MVVLTNSVSNGACRYFSSAIAGKGLIYMWWLWFLSALLWCLALLMCWNLEEGETIASHVLSVWLLPRGKGFCSARDAWRLCLPVPDIAQSWFLERLGSTEGWQGDVEVGTVWSVGRNLAAAKAELRHLPAFDTSVKEDLGKIWRMSESDNLFHAFCFILLFPV